MVDFPQDDPLVAHLQNSPSAAELDKLELDSPMLRALQAEGVKLVVPLVSQGELVGLLNLGPRLSEQEYSADDRTLLDNLAVQAGPAVRGAQLVREQQAEIQAREHLEQELRVARLIQQTLLPKELPALTGWRLAATYQPARAVGGDFYDFINLADGRLGIVIGDVTDKGVPAALLMATTRATLRSAAQELGSPGQVLARANDQLCPEMPPKMFVTCLYAILDPVTGRLQYANAGHDLPYRCLGNQVGELRATGMPLGLMPEMRYDEQETMLRAGETLLFYTDGLVEAHNPEREMFGFPRLKTLMTAQREQTSLIEFLMSQLAGFTGPDWEQEDDVSLMTLECLLEPVYAYGRPGDKSAAGERLTGWASLKGLSNEDLETAPEVPSAEAPDNQVAEPPSSAPDFGDSWRGESGAEIWQVLADFDLPSKPGNERIAIDRLLQAVLPLGLSQARLDRLKTAVGEAAMNAMEHGNKYQADLPAEIRVLASPRVLLVQVTDHGGISLIPMAETPDLEAKLAGLQSPRGWGLFLIQNLVDEMNVIRDDVHHTVELIMYLGPREADDGSAGS